MSLPSDVFRSQKKKQWFTYDDVRQSNKESSGFTATKNMYKIPD